MMRRRTIILASALVTIASAAFGLASCSLGLDESLIGLESDGGLSDRDPVDATAGEGGDGALPPLNPEAGVCTNDKDCKGTTGCLAARCDTPRKACVLDVCRKPACNSAKCDMPGSTCEAAKPYTFRAGQFPVGAQIGCGGNLRSCFAAVYPYVFVGTVNGVVAFAVTDPASTAPQAIPVTGLGFVPNQIIASGSRVYFIAPSVGGTATASRLPIAYVDVTPDPFAVKIPVTTILASYQRPATDGVMLFPRGNDTALLVDTNVATAYGSTPIEPSITEPAVFGSQGLTFTMGSGPQAVSGSRLVMAQINAAQTPIFGFVGGAGSASPVTSADVPITTAGAVTGPFLYSQSPDGALFWGLVALNALPVPPTPQTIRAARGYFLVGDANAPFDPAQGFDLEAYPAVPLGTPTLGPVAMLDANTVLVTTAIPTNTALTNVSIVKKSPLDFLKNTDGTPRRFQITLAVNQLAAAASGGLGYVLAVDPAAPTAPTVYVFDPACAP